MRNELQVFSSEEFGQVRTVDIEGKIYFVAVDIAKALEYSNANDAIKRHCRWVAKHDIPHPQSKTKTIEVNVIPEGDIYRLVANSEMPSAVKFESWIFDGVLPTIRKHGAYLTDAKIEEVLTDPDTIIKIATQLKEERAKRLGAERFNKQIAISENSLLVREVAKIASKDDISIGEKRLWNKLRDWGLIFKNSTEPKQEYVDRGYFEVTEGAKDTYKGTFTYRTTRVTGKGQIYIIKRLLKEREVN